ncbi:MAG TPA: fasciclin domain-containing protein [Cryomorphaceae bacterium]|nr:fasciclin domain-containing protein [Cryomorphaceae bacterium]
MKNYYGIFMMVAVFALSFGDVTAQKKNIVELAAGNEQLSTLVTAVKAAGLVETLSSEGPFTVFAPTNKAFAALPEGVLASLLKPENKDQLVAVLTYHVIPASISSTDLKDGMTAATAQGENIMVDLRDGAKINGANVVKADIKASNGMVHVIDAVILPPSMSK